MPYLHHANIDFILAVILLLMVGSLNGQKDTNRDQNHIKHLDSLGEAALELIQSNKYFESVKVIEELRSYGSKHDVIRRDPDGLLALVYIQHYAYDLAEEHFLIAIDRQEQRKDTFAIAREYTNLAHLYVLNNKLDRYEGLIKKAEEFWTPFGSYKRYYLKETEIMALYKKINTNQ